MKRLFDAVEVKMWEPDPPTSIYHEAHPLHHLTLDEMEEREEAYLLWLSQQPGYFEWYGPAGKPI